MSDYYHTHQHKRPYYRRQVPYATTRAAPMQPRQTSGFEALMRGILQNPVIMMFFPNGIGANPQAPHMEYPRQEHYPYECPQARDPHHCCECSGCF